MGKDPKDFIGWSKEKQFLDMSHRVVYPKPREIWYIKIGINIGKEIYGKNGFFRPVLVVSKIGNMYFCIAMTTKSGNCKYTMKLDYNKSRDESYILINQGRVYDMKRFFTRIDRISKSQFTITKNLLKEKYFPEDL